MAFTALYDHCMSNSRTTRIAAGSEYAIVRASDKAYFTEAGGFSLDVRAARHFDTLVSAQQIASRMRHNTSVMISRLDLFCYAG